MGGGASGRKGSGDHLPASSCRADTQWRGAFAFQCVFVFMPPSPPLPRSTGHCPSSSAQPACPSPPCRPTSAGLLWCMGRRASHYPRRSARREALQRRRRPAAGLAPLPAAGEAGVEGAARSPANPRGRPGGGRAAGGWTCPAGRRGRLRGCRGAASAAAQAHRLSQAGPGTRGTPSPPSRGPRR